MQKIELRDYIYGGHLTIVIGTWGDLETVCSERWGNNANPLPYKDGDPEAMHLGGYHCNLFGMEKGREPFADNIIWVNGELDETEIFSSLTHELLHAGLLLMEMIGVNCTQGSGNHETLTYWHTWAFRTCLNEMKSKKQESKKKK